jgi:DNA-binding LacI/PurR family transcriptional regulator
MATIKEVAELAHVSVGSVSRYLNNPDNLRPDTRERIENAVKQLDFHPNLFARTLRTQNSRTIAVIAQDISNPFYTILFNTIRSIAFNYNYNVVLLSVKDLHGDVDAYLQKASISYFSGIILCYFQEFSRSVKFQETHPDIPMVIMSDDVNYIAQNNSNRIIYSDLEHGFFEATEILIHQGHTNISYIGCNPIGEFTNSKHEGYLHALRDHGLKPYSEIIMHQGHSLSSGYKAGIPLFKKKLPDAVICDADIITLGLLSFLYEHHIHVPEDLSIMSCDDIANASFAIPKLSTIHIPVEQMCQKAMELLLDQLHHKNSDSNGRIFIPNVVLRKSTSNITENDIEKPTEKV